MPLIDPLADLKAEIAAEEAAEAAKAAPAEEPPVEETGEPVEAKVEAKPEPEQKPEAEAKPEGKPAAKPKVKPLERMVPAERMNEYAVKNRQLERRLETLAEELEKLRNPPKPDVARAQPTIEEIRAEERARAKLDLTVDAFVAEGEKEFGGEEFGAACQRIQDLIGAKNNLVTVAVAAFRGDVATAAKAIGKLGKKDAPEIEEFLRLPEAAMGIALKDYLGERAPRAEKGSAPARRTRAVEEQEKPPEPLRPINGATRVEEGLGDDVPDDVWFKRFDETILNKPKH